MKIDQLPFASAHTLGAALARLAPQQSPGEQLAQLIAAGQDQLPLPARRATLQRWQCLAAALAVHACRAKLVEMLVWSWHWAAPGDLRCQRMPQEWPAGAGFDLIVISEMAYYLSEVAPVRGHAVRTLASDGALVLCHWRRPFSDRRLDTDTIHAAFDACPELHNIARHDEADFLLDVWSCSPRSVAQREGVTA